MALKPGHEQNDRQRNKLLREERKVASIDFQSAYASDNMELKPGKCCPIRLDESARGGV